MRYEFTIDHLARVIAGPGFGPDDDGMPVRLVVRETSTGPRDTAPVLDTFSGQGLRIDGARALRGHVGTVGGLESMPPPDLFSAGTTLDVRGAGRFIRGADRLDPAGRWHPAP
jgi:hypothetical protein